MVSAFGSMQALDQLNQMLKTEKDPEVRRRAVRSLGSLKSEQTGKMLVDMYGTEQDVETRKAVITALGNQNNADALVAIARKETRACRSRQPSCSGWPTWRRDRRSPPTS